MEDMDQIVRERHIIAKSFIKSLPFIGALPLVSLSAQAQVLPIAVTASVELHFGAMTVASAGTLSISTAGIRSTTGGVTDIVGAGLNSNGVLLVSGDPGFIVDMSLTSPTFVLNDVAGVGAPMNVDNFDINGSGAVAAISLTATTVSVPLGARLNVGASQGAGLYTGTYTIVANYM